MFMVNYLVPKSSKISVAKVTQFLYRWTYSALFNKDGTVWHF